MQNRIWCVLVFLVLPHATFADLCKQSMERAKQCCGSPEECMTQDQIESYRKISGQLNRANEALQVVQSSREYASIQNASARSPDMVGASLDNSAALQLSAVLQKSLAMNCVAAKEKCRSACRGTCGDEKALNNAALKLERNALQSEIDARGIMQNTQAIRGQ